MTLNEAKSKQKLFHKTATKLLSDKNIPKLLNKYGEMSYVGSYAACLMVKPDIDIEIVNPDISSNKVIELTNAFFTMKDNYSVEIADGTEYIRRPGHPIGYYIGVNMMFEETIWRIDIWVTRKPIDTSDSTYTSMRHQNWYKHIDQDQLDIILLLKHQLNEKGDYSKYASANVYQSVLEGGVTSLDEFYKWAKTYDTDSLFRRGKSRST